MAYFKVTAKFGHCGRNNYYEGIVYIHANNAKEAANLVRWTPRIKHHHKDAILSVEQTDYVLYLQEQVLLKSNRYFSCTSVQDKKKINIEMEQFIKEEPYCFENNRVDRIKYKKQILRKLQRKADKYKNNLLECI